MAGNFNISVTNASDHVRLKLSGYFDGSSACELVHLLNSGGLTNTSEIVVDTDSHKHIHPFGVHVLHNRLHVPKKRKIKKAFADFHRENVIAIHI